MVNIDEIWNVLKSVLDPEIGESIVDMGLIKDVRMDGNQVWIKMTVTSPFCPMIGYMKEDVRRTVEELDGIENVDVEMMVPEF